MHRRPLSLALLLLLAGGCYSGLDAGQDSNISVGPAGGPGDTADDGTPTTSAGSEGVLSPGGTMNSIS